MSRKRMSRREFLRCSAGGASVMIGLPFLEIMTPLTAEAAASAQAKRFIALSWGVGPNIGTYYPKAYLQDSVNGYYSGGASMKTKNYPLNTSTMTYGLMPLAPILDKINLFGGLAHRETIEQIHHGNAPRVFTGINPIAGPNKGYNLRLNPSMYTDPDPNNRGRSIDLVIAEHMMKLNPVPHKAIHMGNTLFDFESKEGKTSYDSFNNAIQIMKNPSANFNPSIHQVSKYRFMDLGWLYYRIFQGLDPKASQQVVSQLTNAKKSILDYVLQDAASLRAKLSAADKVTLDAHLTEIREIEQSLANTVPSGSSCSTDPYPDFANLAKGIDFQPYGVNSWNEGPGGRRFSHECFIRLTTMAFRCNATNVVSYHDSGSTIGYNFWRNSSDYTINVNELKTRKMPNGATRYTNQSLLDAVIRSLKWNDSNGKYIEGGRHDINHYSPMSGGSFDFTREQANWGCDEVDYYNSQVLAKLYDSLSKVVAGPNGETLADQTLIHVNACYGQDTLNLPHGVAGPNGWRFNHSCTGTGPMLIGKAGGIVGGLVRGMGDATSREQGPVTSPRTRSVVPLFKEIARAFGIKLDVKKYALQENESGTDWRRADILDLTSG